MTGLEKIVNQIQEDAKQEADAVLAEAKEKADAILSQAEKEAEQLSADILRKSEKDIINYRKRAQSSMDLKRRTAVLTAKQEMISLMLEKAYEAVCSEEAPAYFQRIEKMLAAYAQPSAGKIFFSEKDLKRMPADFSSKIEAAAKAAGGSLKLSEESIEIENGFVLSYGGIEENCTLKAVFDAKKDELTDQVHKLLYR